jgi:hypothetical protein
MEKQKKERRILVAAAPLDGAREMCEQKLVENFRFREGRGYHCHLFRV